MVESVDFAKLIQTLARQALDSLADTTSFGQLATVSSGGTTTYTVTSPVLPSGLKIAVDVRGKIECSFNADTELQRQEAARLRGEFERAYIGRAYEAALTINGYECSVRSTDNGEVVINAKKQTGESIPVVIDKQGDAVIEFDCFQGKACEKEDAKLDHLLGHLGIKPDKTLSRPKTSVDNEGVKNTSQRELQ
ncbi:MAG: hypothetical protein WD688_19355 [Candidatus Binatia bacterium]